MGNTFAKFNPGQELSGTGNTVGELQKLGYTDKELSGLGANKEITPLGKTAQGGMRGFKDWLSPRQPEQMPQPVQFNAAANQPTAQIPGQNLNYLDDLSKRFQPKPINPFFGG